MDFTSNCYGKLFIDFLNKVKCCILNGRNFDVNDFTSIGLHGQSVRDHVLVPQSDLPLWLDTNTARTQQQFEDAGLLGVIHP